MKTATEAIAAADDQLNRAIGLSGATMLVLGSVIGSGIFLTTGIMMSQLPSTTLVLVAWVAGGLLAMAGGLSYAEMGSMYYVAFAAGEIKDAARVVPRALVIGTVSLTAIYVIVNLAYMWSLTVEEMSGVTRIAERAVSALVGPAGAGLVAATVVISTFGCNVAGVIASSRLCFAMAADRRFFPVAARVHPVYQTPHVALLLTSLWSAL